LSAGGPENSLRSDMQGRTTPPSTLYARRLTREGANRARDFGWCWFSCASCRCWGATSHRTVDTLCALCVSGRWRFGAFVARTRCIRIRPPSGDGTVCICLGRARSLQLECWRSCMTFILEAILGAPVRRRSCAGWLARLSGTCNFSGPVKVV